MAWDTTYDIRFQGPYSILDSTEDELTIRCRTRTLADELIACGEHKSLEEDEKIAICRRLLHPIRKIAKIGKRSVLKSTKWIWDVYENRPPEKVFAESTEDLLDKVKEN